MKKIRIGVMGAYRGTSMINFCRISDGAEVVAICDKWAEAIETQKKALGTDGITYYDSFEDFIQHDMDAVVLANYANEHAPFAIRCLERGLHVFSEVLPCQTMQEAVALVEAVEKSGKVYAYGENYCYMAAPYEMRRLYREGRIGEFEYGECEYIHNCASIWPAITYGDKEHWRNHMYATFYCTHSLGPIIHATGLRPVSVVGFEGAKNERNVQVGSYSGQFGIEMVTLENQGIIKSIHGGLYRDSIWYSMYGSKGRMESARKDADPAEFSKLYVTADEYPGQYGEEQIEAYSPKMSEKAERFGHGGSDYICMENFVKKIQGDSDADTIDVYEALDMFLPGMFAYRSVLNGNQRMAIPDLRNPEEREAYRNDTMCSDRKTAKEQYIPAFSKGDPDIPDEVFEAVRKEFERELSEPDKGYFHAATTQGSSNDDAK